MSTNKKTGNKKIIIGVSLVVLVAVAILSFAIPNTDNAKKTEVLTSSTGEGVTILKSDITEEATFYPYQAGDTYMEVIAIKASDGTIRTALNTCQVCTGSGRGYYEQEGDVLVCQNCGNRFTVDQVEVIKGGCNPVPIFEDYKTEESDIIKISDTFLVANKALFNNWKN